MRPLPEGTFGPSRVGASPAARRSRAELPGRWLATNPTLVKGETGSRRGFSSPELPGPGTARWAGQDAAPPSPPAGDALGRPRFSSLGPMCGRLLDGKSGPGWGRWGEPAASVPLASPGDSGTARTSSSEVHGPGRGARSERGRAAAGGAGREQGGRCAEECHLRSGPCRALTWATLPRLPGPAPSRRGPRGGRRSRQRW